ncbi:ribonuclease H-like domain-containing protein [Patescibacteria group bacterium]|nr:ribonuclease H-like domain-containing protein [Patescibacteria group bacterium]
MQKIFLDIETLPAPEECRQDLELLFKKEKEKKGKANIDFEEYLEEFSFDGTFGRILCIAYAIDDGPMEVLCSDDAGEAAMLGKFWEIAGICDLFIGHNVMDFDLRFIYQRSIINGVRPSKDLNFARYRNFPIFDTMKEWVRWGRDSVGLEKLALSLKIPTPKEGIDGSQVCKFYKAGKVKEILEYCKRDVETTRKVYKRMIFEN